MDELLYSVEDGVGTITFNRQQARNALTWGMYAGLVEAVRAADADGAVRAVVLTGAGEKAFAAGTDIGQFRSFSTPADAIGYEQRIDEVLSVLEGCRKPTIAAMAGACTGAGRRSRRAATCGLRRRGRGLAFRSPKRWGIACR